MLKHSLPILILFLAGSTQTVFSEPAQQQELEARKKILDKETRLLRKESQKEQERLDELQEKLKIWQEENAALDRKIHAEKARIDSQNPPR